MAKQKFNVNDPWLTSFKAGQNLVEKNLIFGPLLKKIIVRTENLEIRRTKDYARCFSQGHILVNRSRRLEAEEWAYVLAHGLLHYAYWHFDAAGARSKADPVKWNVACDMFVTRFLRDIKLFKAPEFINTEAPYPPVSEEELYRLLMMEKLDKEDHGGFSLGAGFTDMDDEPKQIDFVWMRNKSQEYKEIFESSLTDAVCAAVEVAAGHYDDLNQAAEKKITKAEKARRWFIDHYPLLGALAAAYALEEDSDVCLRAQIAVAAVSESLATIYINSRIKMTEQECRFIIAHELLHVGLRHHSRCQGRDPFLWNVACDFIINGWLVEMRVGVMPEFECLYDLKFKDMSAEQVYDAIVRDIRRFKKLATLRGVGLSDILGEGEVGFKQSSSIDLDEFYRRALTEGLEYHKKLGGRGFLPAGLEEEIRALYRRPIDWDVRLARWFDSFFEPLEKIRTYACLSRRQASTPDIPRPRLRPRPESMYSRTFGVVIDTSGSMDRYALAVALGTVASYASSRDVPFVRVVYCDAAAYDAGYVSPEAIMSSVRIKGRGGTILQPGIDRLQQAEDFPKDGPILIITDGKCDRFVVKRPHAVLLPKGRRLPFPARGEIFEFE
ncbi:MAG: VWA-like domain-containing protein [Deltaproteobacteria bacterium]|jgi:predicted metal-dependent peptidase|nr:VWA-like domain-containing protein [Deltaproteobacteria bacterium]